MRNMKLNLSAPRWNLCFTIGQCLLDGKYLLPDCIVHHINLDTLDNRLENLWLTTSQQEHNLIHNSLTGLVKPILELGFLVFEKGKYQLNY